MIFTSHAFPWKLSDKLTRKMYKKSYLVSLLVYSGKFGYTGTRNSKTFSGKPKITAPDARETTIKSQPLFQIAFRKGLFMITMKMISSEHSLAEEIYRYILFIKEVQKVTVFTFEERMWLFVMAMKGFVRFSSIHS